jgi:hypothetical protein
MRAGCPQAKAVLMVRTHRLNLSLTFHAGIYHGHL